MTHILRAMAIICLLSLDLVSINSLAQSVPNAAQTLPTESLIIDLGEQGQLNYNAEIADTQTERAIGLMFRESLAENASMLFVFETERDPQMWMKNTLISLDMLFLNSEGVVVAIARETVPGSLRRVSAGIPIKGVLEINGGQAAERGILPGSIVRHPSFGNMQAANEVAAAVNESLE